MTTFFTALAGAVGGSAITTALAIPILKHLLQKFLDLQLKKAEDIFHARLALAKESETHLRQKELTIFPELSELVYKAKAGADEVKAAKSLYNLTSADLTEACRELTSRIYSYRIYLGEGVFAKLHEYKHALQDILVSSDIPTRLDHLESHPSGQLSPPERLQLEEACGRVAI